MTEPSMEVRACPRCGKLKPQHQMAWTCDRYGIPWKKVCVDCHLPQQRENDDWTFDPADAGERLEDEG